MNTLTAEQRTLSAIAVVANVDIKDFGMDDDLVEGLGLDSLDMVELVMSVEEAFGIEIPDDAAEKWKTVKDVTGYVAGLGIQ